MADKYNKQFIAYNSKSSYDADVIEEKLEDSSIVFVKESGEETLRTQSKEFKFVPDGYTQAKGLLLSTDGTKPVWVAAQDLDTTSKYYGVQWSDGDSSPELTRIGNINYHRSLPLQSKMYGCIVQSYPNTKEVYKLKADDWDLQSDLYQQAQNFSGDNVTLVDGTEEFNGKTWKKATVLLTQQCVIHMSYYVSTDAANLKNRWDKHYIRLGLSQSEEGYNKCYVKTATYDESTQKWTFDILYPTDGVIKNGSNTVYIYPGSDLTGWDGNVMVYVPGGYLYSTYENGVNQVMIADSDVWGGAEQITEQYYSAYKLTKLRSVPANYGYLSTLKSDYPVSVCNSNDYCAGIGDTSVTTEDWKGVLRKPMRDAYNNWKFEDSKMSALSYRRYKWLVWLYVIEYASFNVQKDFKANKNSVGFAQGGLGEGFCFTSNDIKALSQSVPVMIGSGNALGNSTGVVPMSNDGFIHRVEAGSDPFADCMPMYDPYGKIFPFTKGQYTAADGSVYFTHYSSSSYAGANTWRFYDLASDWSEYPQTTKLLSLSKFRLSKKINIEVTYTTTNIGVDNTYIFEYGNTSLECPSGESASHTYTATLKSSGDDDLVIYSTRNNDVPTGLLYIKITNVVATDRGIASETWECKKWRGIEDPFAAGLVNVVGLKMAYDETGNYYTASYNSNDLGHIPNTQGYISKINTTTSDATASPYGNIIPVAVKGSSKTYQTDLLYCYKQYNAVMLTGGHQGESAGLFHTTIVDSDPVGTGNINGFYFGTISK